MTTLAYKNGIIAYDSYLTAGETIVDLNYDKHHKFNKYHFFLSGTTWLYPGFIDSFIAGENLVGPEKKGNVSGFVVCPNNFLWEAAIGTREMFWFEKVSLKVPRAFGTGDLHALTAMDMGASAREAVKMATKRDIYTGGKIRTFNIKTST